MFLARKSFVIQRIRQLCSKNTQYVLYEHDYTIRHLHTVCVFLCFSVEAEQLWVWEYETEDGTHDLFMDINEEIRFRVIDEEFIDLTPEGPAPPTNTEGESSAPSAVVETKKSPYTITVSCHSLQ